jgi:hypothetical protein
MVRTTTDWDPDDPETKQVALALEAVLEGLRHGVRVASRELERLLLSERAENPMLGIVGAHSLLLSRRPDWSLFDRVVDHLRAAVPGHPDVTALAAIGEDRRRARVPNAPDEAPGARWEPVAWPPMLVASYRGLVRCDARWPSLGLIAEQSVAERATGQLLTLGTWSSWAPLDEDDVTAALDSTGELRSASKSEWIRNAASAIASAVATSGGGGVPRQDWQRIIETIPADQSTDCVRRYLSEMVQRTTATSVREFLQSLDVGHLSLATGAPARVVQTSIDSVYRAIERAEAPGPR